MGSVIGSIPELAGKAFDFVDNAIERQVNRDAFVGCDQTPYEVICRNELMSVRYYPPLQESSISLDGEEIPVSADCHQTPILLVPPLGVSAWIFDLLQDRSLVRCMLSQGLPVYMIDWGKPTKNESHISLEKYVLEWLPQAVNSTRQHSGEEQVSLVGYCFGGLLSLMQAANEPSTIRNIVTIASPIDFRKMGLSSQLPVALGNPKGKYARLAKKSIGSIKSKHLHVSGTMIAKGFVLTNPMSCMNSYLKMFARQGDREYITAYTTKRMWFSEMLDFPGATARNLLVNLWLGNEIVNGVMKLDGAELHFNKVESNLLAFASRKDKIVNHKAAKEIMSVTQSQDKTFCDVPGGHAGVFSGSNAGKNVWLPSAYWLKSRSN